MTLRRGGRRGDGSASLSQGDAPPTPPPPTQVAGQEKRGAHATVADRLGLGPDASVRLPAQKRVAAAGSPATPSPSGGAGRYEVLDEIGRGGMGAVLTATDRDLGREVAMKVILDASDPETLVRFTREAQISGQLEHPNITPVHELGVDPQGRVYFTMKLVRGDSLTKKLNELKKDVLAGRGEERFPLAKRLQIFTKMCEALAYAHNRGVIHRDLKPDNIMVGEFGEVHVMDWGLARLVDEEEAEDSPAQRASGRGKASGGRRSSRRDAATPQRSKQLSLSDDSGSAYRTLEGDVMGTPNYMAPEQARGEIGKLDPRADVYALGIILYEMLTLCRAFDGTEVERILKDVENGRFLEPRRRIEREKRLNRAGLRVPRELEAIVLKAMATDPRKRYQSAKELADDVDAYLHGRATSAADYSPVQLAYIWVRSNKLKTTIAAAFVLLAVSGIFVFEWARTAEREQQLEPYREDVRAAVEAVESLEGLIEQGAYEPALAAAQSFPDEYGRTLLGVSGAAVVNEHLPELVERAEALPKEVERRRQEAIRGWLAEEIAALPEPAVEMPPGTILQARTMRTRFAEFLAEEGLEDLPVSEFAYWQAQVAIEQDDPSMLAEAVADAFMLQPQSLAAGRTFLLQASDTLARCLALEDGADPTLASLQFHLALSAFGDMHPQLRPEALLGLAQSLALMPPRDPTPFDTDVPTREMALRAVLELMTLDGQLRPEVAEVLDEATRDALRQQGNDLLYALRRTTASGPTVRRSVDFNNDGTHDAVTSAGREATRLRRPVPPEEPGLGSHRWETFREYSVEEIMRQLVEDRAPEGLTLESHWPVHIKPEAEQPGGLFLVVEEAETPEEEVNHLIVTSEFDASGTRSSFSVPGMRSRIREAASADFTGNGLKDIVVAIAGTRRFETRICRVYVLFQEEPGHFSDSLEVTTFNSEIRGLIAEDLNGDGQPEVLISAGEWQKLSLEVFEYLPSAHHFAAMYEQRVGDGNPMLIDDPESEQPLIAISSFLPFSISFFFELQGEPIESEDVMLFRYSEGKLHRLDHPLRETPLRGNSVRIHGRLLAANSPEERVLVASGSGSRSISRVMRFHHFRGSLLDPESMRSTLVSTHRRLHSDGNNLIPGYLSLRGGGGSYRTLRDKDLAPFAEKAVPIDPPQRDEATIVAIVRILLASELYDEAVRVIREVRYEESRQEVLHALTKLELLALIDAQRYDDVIEAVGRLTPTRNLVADVLFGTRTLAEIGRFREAYELLDPWAITTERTARQREMIDWQRNAWRDLAELYEQAPTDEIRGYEVHRQGEEEPGHLADYLLANSPQALRLRPGSGPASHWYVSGPERTWVGLRSGERPGELSPRRRRPVAGIPMRLGSDSFRITAVIRLPGVPYDTEYTFGPQPIRHLFGGGSSRSRGLRISNGGGNHINHVRVNRHMRMDNRIGQRLRLDMIYMRELDHTRVILTDLDDEEILFERIRSGRLIRPGMTVFGIVGGAMQENTRSELELHYLGVQGDAQLMRADQREVRRELIESPTVTATSRAMRHMMRSEWEQAQAEFEALAEQFRGIAEANEEGRDALEQQARFYEIEAVRAGAAGDVRQLGSELVTLLREERISVQELFDWLRAKPHYRGGPDLWPGVGRAIGAYLYPERNALAALNEARAEQVDPLILAALTAWAHDDDPDNPEIHELLLRATLAATTRVPPQQYGHDIYWGTNPMGWRLLEVFERAPASLRTGSSDLRTAYAAILSAMHRRRDAQEVLAEEDLLPMTGFQLLQQRMLERARNNERNRQESASRRGFAFEGLPPIRY